MKGLVSAFADDLDIHRATAAEVFGMALDEVTADQRRSAKAINFGLMYGMSAFGLGKQLGIARSEAQTYIDLYFDRYPGVKAFMDEIKDRARSAGYVETLFGRRLYLPEINDRNAQRRQYAERSAINAPMQGTAADIIKKAMIAVHRWIEDEKPPARMIMQVHDELVFEVDENECESVRDRIVSLMSRAAELSVTLKVDAGTAATGTRRTNRSQVTIAPRSLPYYRSIKLAQGQGVDVPVVRGVRVLLPEHTVDPT
jgi:DNA polymerase I